MAEIECPSCGSTTPRLQWRWESMSQGRAPGRLLVLAAWCSWCGHFVDIVNEQEYGRFAGPKPI